MSGEGWVRQYCCLCLLCCPLSIDMYRSNYHSTGCSSTTILTWTSGTDSNLERWASKEVERTLHRVAPRLHCNQGERDQIVDSLYLCEGSSTTTSRRGEARSTIKGSKRDLVARRTNWGLEIAVQNNKIISVLSIISLTVSTYSSNTWTQNFRFQLALNLTHFANVILLAVYTCTCLSTWGNSYLCHTTHCKQDRCMAVNKFKQCWYFSSTTVSLYPRVPYQERKFIRCILN